MNTKLMFSSVCLGWETPIHVLSDLQAEFGWVYFDPCPTKPNFNGLNIEWNSKYWNFVNPPYGREIGNWCKKSYEESLKGHTVVMLIPSRTDTRWWHDYIMKADEIRFIKGRLKFKGAKNSASFPSAIIVFRGNMKC